MSHLLLAVFGLWFPSVQQSPGKIIAKEFFPADRSSPLTDTTLGSPVAPLSAPDTWWIEIEVAGMRGGLSIDRGLYDSLGIGDEVEVEYATWKLPKILRIKNIRAKP